MSNKFDLERFKAGEPAIAHDGTKRFYIGMKKDISRVVVEFENGCVDHFAVEYAERAWAMQPQSKEEWVLVSRMNKNRDIYSSKQEAEDDCSNLEFWEAVKIIRE